MAVLRAHSTVRACNQLRPKGIGYTAKDGDMTTTAKFFKSLPKAAVPTSAEESLVVSQEEREISDAAERVYERYGTDLTAFLEDVRRAVLSRREAEECLPH
jgi:hypothetical protein